MPFSALSLRIGRLLGIAGLLIGLAAPAAADSPDETTAEDQTSIHTDVLIPLEIDHAPIFLGAIDLTETPDDLWERIRNGFAMNNLNDDLVLHYQQRYESRPGALRRMVERSRPYLFYIVEELEARGMPSELALLPMVESAFNPQALSSARASGLWQFIPATGKRFNLEQNWWRDERRDVVASTNAALDYLQSIYDMHGDWHLALASYNWGEGAVKRAVGKNEAKALPTDYASLRMPNETRHYVPKLQALKNIFGNPAQLARLDLPRIPNSPYFATLETPRPMDVKTAARLADMPLDEFRQLNPAHNRPIIQPDTPLVLPADKVEAFLLNLQNHQEPLSQWQVYMVTSTERVDRIASRIGASTTELIQANGLPGNVRLVAGSRLLIPGDGNVDSLQRLFGLDASPIIIQPEPRPARGKRGAVKASGGSKVKGGKKAAPATQPKVKPAKKTGDKSK
ncbi:MAG: transglycosylase SLT domain-containing protein [Betaproteobacteria bacterium]|nr:transglycosylase SLT domain-containing protein [Betaproteobacteria bacterium]MCL2887312.1 transglycosylase SLT domain-containing protein [Betaproteobacteria bacterium]